MAGLAARRSLNRATMQSGRRFPPLPAGPIAYRPTPGVGCQEDGFRTPLCRLRRRAMHLAPCLKELRDGWFPHTTTTGLDRLIQLLESGSPLLIHGAFTR